MDFFETYRLDVALGVVILAFVVYTRLTLNGLRRRSIRVRGKVVHIARHHRTTAHFIAFELDGEVRHADYRGWNTGLEVGSELDILIDPKAPPDVEVPAPGAIQRVQGTAGNCLRPEDPKVSFWELVHLTVALVLIVRGLCR